MKTKLFSACVVLLIIATAACKQAPSAADTQNIASPQKTAATPAARMLTASTSMARITVTVTNDSSFGNTYEFYDNVAQTALPQQTIAAHGSSTLDLKSSQALTDGYGSFKSKKSDSGTWNNFDLLRHGEKKSLN